MTQGAGDAARDAALEAKERLADQAGQARDAAQGRLREQVDTRSTQAGEQATSTASAVRGMSDQLRSQGQAGAARVSDEVANRLEQMGGYLRDSDAGTIVRDVEDFARRQPWLVVAAGLALGVAGARFLKASSRRRYRPDAGTSHGAPRPRGWAAADPSSLPPVERRDVEETLAGAPVPEYAGQEEPL